MKFTGHLSIAAAERKWEERSNPALAYIRMKQEHGDILIDIETVKALLQNNRTLLSRYIAVESTGAEYLTMVKRDVLNAAQKWATEKGFPAKTINGGSIGKALTALGYPNVTVNKKINSTTPLKAWSDIFIDLATSDLGSGPAAFHENPSIPPPSLSRTDKITLGSGAFTNHAQFLEHYNIEEDRDRTHYLSTNPLGNTEENAVSVDFREPLPSATEGGVKITLEDGKLIVSQLLGLGYHLDPDSGVNIDRKYYKIGIHGIHSLTADKREKLEHILAKENFKPYNPGTTGTLWYVRPLARTSEGA